MISKPYEDNFFEDAKSAMHYISEEICKYISKKEYASMHICVNLYGLNDDKLDEEIDNLYHLLKIWNIWGLKLINQLLPTNPFPFRHIIGCLGVQAYEISIETYGARKGKVSITGYNKNVLNLKEELQNDNSKSNIFSSL